MPLLNNGCVNPWAFFSKILSIVEHGSGMVTPRSDNGHTEQWIFLRCKDYTRLSD
nr:MAG TPA: hypothetical protein [Caudoviricetes sp.]